MSLVTTATKSIKILQTGPIKAYSQKDICFDDKIITEARKRVNSIEKESIALRNKISKRVQSKILKLALEVISEQKWKIYNVDMYNQNDGYFQLSFRIMDSDLKSDKLLVPKYPVKKKVRGLGATSYAFDAAKDCPRQPRQPKQTKIRTLSELVSVMEYYGSTVLSLDNCSLGFNYETITLTANGKGSRDLVFALAKKLRLKIDYASYIQTTEFAEAEIVLRKQLIDDLSTEILFGI